jgi:hypothetical protein
MAYPFATLNNSNIKKKKKTTRQWWPLEESQLKAVDGPVLPLQKRSNTYFCDYVTKKYFQDKDILSKSLDAFKRDDKWTCRSEKVMKDALDFFNSCRIKSILSRGYDYEMLLPFLVMCLKEISIK